MDYATSTLSVDQCAAVKPRITPFNKVSQVYEDLGDFEHRLRSLTDRLLGPSPGNKTEGPEGSMPGGDLQRP